MLTFLILGIVLLVVGYNLPQPIPLNELETWGGWICLLVALVLFIVWIAHGGPAATGTARRRSLWRW